MEFIAFLSFWGLLAAIGCVWCAYYLLGGKHQTNHVAGGPADMGESPSV